MGDNKGFLGMHSHLIASDIGSCQNKFSCSKYVAFNVFKTSYNNIKEALNSNFCG